MITALIRRWAGVDKLEAEIERLKKRDEIAIDALKDIAINPQVVVGFSAVDIADRALRKIGLTPFRVDPLCPRDRIYFMPQGMGGRPTDYI